MGLLRVWECSLLYQIIDGFADALHNIDERHRHAWAIW